MVWPFTRRRKPARAPRTGWVPTEGDAVALPETPAAPEPSFAADRPAVSDRSADPGPAEEHSPLADQPSEQPSEPPPPRRAGALRRNRWLDRQGFYEPRVRGIKSTTRQAEALNIAVAAPPTSPRGLIIGQDAETGQSVAHDPFEAYFDGIITSPNCIVIGDVGKGKSSLLKTWAVLRQLLLGRRVVVIDKKLDGKTKEGEYAPTARKFGVEPIKFSLDGTGSRINVLDPVISARETVGEASPAGQAMLLRAVLAEALERPLTPKEGKALRVAHRTALRRARQEQREAVIGDIVDALLQPDADAARDARVDEARLLEWGYDAAFELERMIEEDLAGLVDAPTSGNVNLDAGLTVFDVSALPETGPALPIVMSIINTWLMNVLANQDEPVQTVFVVEEGWHLIEGSFAKVARRNWKLARGLGLCNVVAVHHISDVPADSPAIAMVKEAETVFIYGQAKEDDARECVRLFNLPSTAMNILLELPKGTPLVKIGSADPIIVSHLRSDLEVELTNTDAAMNSTGVIVRAEEADLGSVEVSA